MPTDPQFSGGSDSDFADFLADYFIECDEHLAAARRSVLALEPLIGAGNLDRGLLDELFRSFHSLKGLSAMVGFHEAEQLAHHFEALLAAVRKNQVPLDLSGLEILIAGIKALEQCIAARRDSEAAPNLAPLMARVLSLMPGAGASADTSSPASGGRQLAADLGSKDQAIAERVRAGATAWRIRFEPSPELVVSGVDVNFIRRKLQQLGELIHSEPLIDASGRIVFSFILVTNQQRVAEQLELPGLRFETYTPAPAKPSQRARAETPEVELSTHLTPANLVRVDLGRLDDLMRMVSELVLSRARLDDNLRRIAPLIPGAEQRALQETIAAIERQLRDLREGIMRVRMVPVREVFARMQFVVRDLVRELGKQATLQLSGEDTQIDKYVVERIMDPLLHLVRNSLSHGLEPAEERLAAGKNAVGQIHLRAKTTGETVVIEVEDDGRGIDADAVLARARAQGLISNQADESASLLDVLCIPGFSTREHADRASGRGVGMDVVRMAVEEMGGALILETAPGRGTRFTIHLPLTLAITDALIVAVGSQRFAVPQAAVREVVFAESSQPTAMENNELLRHHSGVLALLRLDQLFGLPAAARGDFYALVVGEGAQAVGLVVDRVLGLREVVVRPLTDRLVKVPGVAGATELGDGKVVLILDVANLIRLRRRPGSPLPAALPSPASGEYSPVAPASGAH